MQSLLMPLLGSRLAVGIKKERKPTVVSVGTLTVYEAIRCLSKVRNFCNSCYTQYNDLYTFKCIWTLINFVIFPRAVAFSRYLSILSKKKVVRNEIFCKETKLEFNRSFIMY